MNVSFFTNTDDDSSYVDTGSDEESESESDESEDELCDDVDEGSYFFHRTLMHSVMLKISSQPVKWQH